MLQVEHDVQVARDMQTYSQGERKITEHSTVYQRVGKAVKQSSNANLL